jgi:hypothetical protein
MFAWQPVCNATQAAHALHSDQLSCISSCIYLGLMAYESYFRVQGVFKKCDILCSLNISGHIRATKILLMFPESVVY